MEIIKLEIEKVKHNPINTNVYGDIAEDKLQDLMASMSTEGQLEAITINQSFEIISGARRYEAAKRLGWKTIDTIQIEVREEETPIQMVNRNITRGKKASVLLKEYEALMKKYSSYQGRRTDLERPSSKASNEKVKTNTREFIADLLNLSEGTLQNLLDVAKKDPEQIKAIDSGSISISGAAKVIRDIKTGNGIPAVIKPSEYLKHDVVHSKQYDGDGKYADDIIETFLNLVEEAKKESEFRLEDKLEEAISTHENKVDEYVELEEKAFFSMLKIIKDAIRRKEYEPFRFKDGVLTPVSIEETYKELNIDGKPEKDMLLDMAIGTAQYLFSKLTHMTLSNKHRFVFNLKEDLIGLSEYQVLGTNGLLYCEKFCAIAKTKYILENSTLSPTEVGKIKKQLINDYQAIRPFVRIKHGLCHPLK